MKIKESEVDFEHELASVLAESKYTLINLKLIKQNKSTELRITIDHDGGVSHQDCKRVTEIILEFLEEKNLLPECGIEVSSPGVNRELKSLRELEAFQGRKVLISFLDEAQLLQETGLLKAGNGDQITFVSDDQEEKALPIKNVRKIRLVD